MRIHGEIADKRVLGSKEIYGDAECVATSRTEGMINDERQLPVHDELVDWLREASRPITERGRHLLPLSVVFIIDIDLDDLELCLFSLFLLVFYSKHRTTACVFPRAGCSTFSKKIK